MIMATESRTLIEGSAPQICMDFIHIVSGFHETIAERYGDDTANELIAILGRLAMCKNEDELMEATKEFFENKLAELLK